MAATMTDMITTRPRLPFATARVVSSALVVLVVAAGAWVVAYGLPTGETASWWVLGSTLVLLVLAVAGWRYVDVKRLSLLQRCLILSALLHVLIAAGFSAVVVVRQVARVLAQEEVITPSVNLNLSREMEVREQIRQQVSVDLPVAAPVPSLVRQDVESPLPPPPDAPARIEPVGIPGMPWRQIAAQQSPVPPTIPMAPPSSELVTPLVAVRPDIVPLPESTLIPAAPGVVDTAKDWAHLAGPLTEQLAAKATSPIAGTGMGSLGAPPASLETGTISGGSPTGSGTGRSLTMLATASPPRLIDLPVPTMSPPPPSSPELMAPRGAGGFGDALGQRAFDRRQKMLDKYGGTPETEAAVARSLLYLSRVQGADGRWTKIGGDGKRSDNHDVGLTGLAVLCYLAANHTPGAEGPYKETVTRGIQFLLSVQKADGDMRGEDGNMYDHAIGALALGEAAAMLAPNNDKDKKIRAAAHRAAQFCLDAQNHAGAWRYKPRDWFTDTSVTGWQVMALHSAERTGFAFSDETKIRVLKFLSSVSKGEQGMLTGYLTAAPTHTMTAEAVFTRMLMKQRLSDEALREAAAFLTSPARDGLDYYYVYYGSMALMQMQGDAWQRWNAATSKLLIALQERRGADAGSFSAVPNGGGTEWSDRGGLVYTTALATLSLEVYYRYLPMYAK